MEAKMLTVVCVLVSAGLVAGHYNMPTVIMDNPSNSVCPPDSHMDAVRTQLSNKISGMLAKTCGGSEYGWKKIAFLNMTDPDQNCPAAWRLYEYGLERACGRPVGVESCDSVQYSSDGYAYTQVCGRITGYQYASPDAGNHVLFNPTPGNEINEPYLDGISITYGNPRTHIWSFYGSVNPYVCCDTQHADNLESLGFIGNNSFCDTGNPTDRPWPDTHFTDHPLWDGINHCAASTTCCTPHPGPWFYTTLPLPSLYDIEVRICADQSTNDEDTPVKLIELYVK